MSGRSKASIIFSKEESEESRGLCSPCISTSLQDGQRSVGAKSFPKTAQILRKDENNASHACLELGFSSLLLPEAGSRGFFISLRIPFTCPSAVRVIGTAISTTEADSSCVNLHVAVWRLGHVCSRSPLTASTTSRSWAGGHI